MDFIKYNSYWKVINEITGYDFSGYTSESLVTRLEKFISTERIASPDELRDKLFTDAHTQETILGNLLVSYTEMFRDPFFFDALRKNVLPFLSTYPVISIWHAGCSTGEEVYSLAILLQELNMLDRCRIYATDINEQNLRTAQSGIYSLQKAKESGYRYLRAGGKQRLSNHYTAYYDHIIFKDKIRDKIKFIKHDLVNGEPVSRFHLILCRNVFIYFNYVLQNKALKNIYNNLYNYGYFAMGAQELFVNTEMHHLSTIDTENRIYRKVI